MNMKGIVLAAALVSGIAASTPARADAISTALGLIDYNFAFGQHFFQSNLASDGEFLSKLVLVANTSTFTEILSSFVAFGVSEGGSINQNTFSGAFAVGTNPNWISTIAFNQSNGSITFAGNTITAATGNNDTVVPVPGPEAGAGIGALALAGMAYAATRRRKFCA